MDQYWLSLSAVDGLGWRRLELLLKYYGDVENVWESEPSEWLKLGVNKRVVESFERVRRKNIDFVMLSSKYGIKYVIYGSTGYPMRLLNIASPPIVLYYIGNVDLTKGKNVIGVIGTRRCTRYGRDQTDRFVKYLSSRGNVIVSGLANGIDTVAHESCLYSGGETIAVLAHGLDITYPENNKYLRDNIVSSGGLVVSEKPVNVKPSPEYFIHRNRIVAGLSDLILVGEAPKKSGTKVTVGFAADQGKDVYVITGPANYSTYKGNNEIIRDGGIPVSDPDEIEIKYMS